MRNCLTYSLSMRIRHGGYLKYRRSMLASFHGKGSHHILNLVPHFLHESKEGVVTQLVRTESENERAKKLGPWMDWAWLWHFEGRVVYDDKNYLGSNVK